MHPTLGRVALNIIFLLALLDIFALLLLNPGDAEFYVAILGLAILFGSFLLVTFEAKREAKKASLKTFSKYLFP